LCVFLLYSGLMSGRDNIERHHVKKPLTLSLFQVSSPLLNRNAKALPVDKNYGTIHDFAINQYKTLLAETMAIPRRATDVIKEAGTNTIMFAHKLLASAKEFASSPGGFKLGEQYFSSPPSNVLRRLPGFSIGVASFGGSLIDSTQFSWRFGVRIVLRLVTAQKGEDLAPVLWQVLSDSSEDVDTYLVKPGFRACAGLGVMLGYSNPWARLFRESCTSAVASQATVLDIVEVMFIRIPTLACICRDSAGENFATYARAHCWAPAPSHMKPLLAQLISDSVMDGMAQSQVCEKYGAETDDMLRASMDPVMQHAYAATEAVGSALDYFTLLIDPQAGNCAELVTSPYTMAIVPEPIDYFRGCSRTSTCRSKCQTQFTEFDEVRLRLAQQTRTVPFQSHVEKKFFSETDVLAGKSSAPFEILAMMEVDANAVYYDKACCGSTETRDRCIVVCGMNTDSMMQVNEYCVPHNIGVGTHLSFSWVAEGSDKWASSVRSVRFATRDELMVASENDVTLYARGHSPIILMRTMDPLSSAQGDGINRIAWIFSAPGSYGIIHGFVNEPGGQFSSKKTMCLDFSVGARRVQASKCDSNLDLVLNDHTATCIGEPCNNLLMLPTTRIGIARYCIPDGMFHPRIRLNFRCVDSFPDPMLATTLGYTDSSESSFVITSDFRALRRTPLMCANCLFVGNASIGTTTRVFNANPISQSSTWLQEVRLNWDMTTGSMLTGVRKSASQSSTVNILIQQRCAVDDCSGCMNAVVQRACYATMQCTVTKCIGTVVNLERPMCSVGRLLQAGLDVDLVKMQGVSKSVWLAHALAGPAYRSSLWQARHTIVVFWPFC
jgi:hypothetical protein